MEKECSLALLLSHISTRRSRKKYAGNEAICAARPRGSLKARTFTTCRGAAGWPSGADNESGQTGATRRVTRWESFTSACPLCRRRSARRKGCRSSPSASSARCTPAPRWSFNTAAKGLASAKFSLDDQSATRLRFHFLNTHGSHYIFIFLN